MTRYTVKGYEVLSDHKGHLIGQDSTVMEVIVPNAIAQLGAAYLNDDVQDMSVKLSDYNVKLDGTHLHDDDAPTAIELFTLSTPMGQMTTVLNFSYRAQNTQLDRFYAVEGDPLPELTEPAALQRFLGQTAVAPLDDAAVSIKLCEMPEVEIHGFFTGFDGMPANAIDEFQFKPDLSPTDELTAFDIASDLQQYMPEPSAADFAQPSSPSAADWEDALLALSEVFTPDTSSDIIPS